MKDNIIKISNEKFTKVEEFSKIQIPQYAEKENKQKGWIESGKDNKYPFYLKSLLDKSPIHSGIVKKKSQLIGGRGFITTNLGLDAIYFLKNSRNSMDLDEISSSIAYDFEIYGAFALNIIWSKDRETISEINYIDVSKLRVAIPDEEDPEVEAYWISDGWENTKKYPPVKYDGFSTINRKSASQIWYVKDHRAGTEWYGLPEYISGIFWMEMQIQISQFHLANLSNGFHPSFMINWPVSGNFSDEEMDVLISRLKRQFQGSVNAGEVFITVTDPANAPTMTPIEANTSDERFVNLQNLIERSILQSHRVNNPELFGLPQEGKLGNSSKGERMESMQEFEIDYIIPKQQIIEKVFNKLARINGIKDKLFLSKYTDQYKKVGSDSATEVLSIISNGDITPKQKYTLLISLNYTHQLASDLSAYYDGNNLKEKGIQPQSGTQSGNQPQKHHFIEQNKRFEEIHNKYKSKCTCKSEKFDEVDGEDGDVELHPNCRCRIENGVYIVEEDACDACIEAAQDFNM